MNKILRTFLAAGFVLMAMLLTANGATFTASLDRDTISVGDSATLTLTFEGGSPQNIPTPSVDGLLIGHTGNSQSYNFVNGQSTTTLGVTFSVTPKRDGQFTIPAMTVNVNGQQLSSQPLKLIVEKAHAPSTAAINSGNEIAFMKLEMPDKKIYSGETFVGQLKLFLRNDVQNVANFQLIGTPADGFTVGKISEGTRFRTQVGNRIYVVVPLSIALTATRSGNASVGPFTAKAIVVLPSQNGNNEFPFFSYGEQKQISLATDELNVQLAPLPDENVPAGFNGAIGDFQMTMTVGPTNVTVGDPITVRMQISGRGTFDAVKLPDDPAGWKDFKIFTPTSKTDFSDQLGLQGVKTFEEIVTPQNTNVQTMPKISFSFFNPDDGKYHTINRGTMPLAVSAAGASAVPTIAATKNNGQENSTPDISPIKENPGTLQRSSAPLISQPVFLAVQSLPVLAFLGAFIWRKRADNLANNPRLRRQRAVAQLTEIGISDLKKFAAANNSDEFFALLFRLLQEQLGERLDCPATAITENVVDENSILRVAPENVRNGLRELFQLCNQARYAPVRGTAELNSVATQFETLVGQLKEVEA